MLAPDTSACPTFAAAATAVRCWRSRPGFFRPERIFSIRNGLPVRRESEREVRRIWPPPSPNEPSMVMIFIILFCRYYSATNAYRIRYRYEHLQFSRDRAVSPIHAAQQRRMFAVCARRLLAFSQRLDFGLGLDAD